MGEATTGDDVNLSGELAEATELVRARKTEHDALRAEIREIMKSARMRTLMAEASDAQSALHRAEETRDLAALRILGWDPAQYAHTNDRNCENSPTGLCLFVVPGLDECVVCRRGYIEAE